MFSIGVVNIDTSHPLAWSEILLKENRGRYTAIYNDGFRGDDEVHAFMEKRGLKRCASVDELVEITDIGFIQGCNWDRHLTYAQAFIKRGKPCFIDKPMVGNLADCKKVLDLASKGAKLLGCSSLRYAQEIVEFVNRPVAERGEIVHVSGTCGVDEFNYGIHVVEALGGLIGTGAQSVRHCGTAAVAQCVCDNYQVHFANGVSANYHTLSGTWLPCHFLITTTKGVFTIAVDTNQVYKALLDQICNYMEGKKNQLAHVKDIIESVEIMLAGRLSRLQGGNWVNIHDIPESDPGFDGKLFEEGYAANASKIYLD